MTDTPKLDSKVPDRLKPRSHRMMLDSLEIEADIGFHDFEVGNPQRLLVTVELWLDAKSFADEDHPEAAWNYDHLRKEIIRIASDQRYNLQETLARRIYRRFAAMTGVEGLRVATSKPDIYQDARGVGVEISSFD